MSEITYFKQINGAWEINYINGEWAVFQDVTEEDKIICEKKGIEHIYNNYLEVEEVEE